MRARWRLTVRVTRLTLRTDRGTTLMIVGLVFAQAGVVAMTGLSQRWLVDGAAEHVAAAVVAAVVVGAAARAMSGAGGRVQSNMQLYLTGRVTVAVTHELLRSIAALPTVSHVERPEQLNRVMRLCWGGGTLAALPLSGLGTAAAVLSLVVSVLLLGTVHPLLWVLAVLAVPPLLASRRANRIIRAAQDANAELLRRERRSHELCTQPDPARELFIAGGTKVDRQAARLWQTAIDRESAARLRAFCWQSAGWLVYLTGLVAGLLFVDGLIGAGQASLGDAVLLFSVATQLQAQVRLVVEQLRALADGGNVVDDYWWLQDQADRHRGAAWTPATLRHGVEMQGVSFRYPGAERDSLTDVDLLLPAGSTVAIVGDNGAGKTTMVNLLTGLYEPTAGRVTIDGRPLSQLDVRQWQARLSGVPQHFARMQFLVQESVGVGDLSRLHDAGTVGAAVDRAGGGSIVAGLPDGLRTQLGRTFGGVDPSPGQWQRLALARALMRPEPLLVVLDEPTAALDPQAEYELFQRFAHQVRVVTRRGGVALLISHRLTTVRMADLIVVLGGGRVVEQGSHDELLAAGGSYAEMVRLQQRAFAGDPAGPAAGDRVAYRTIN